LQKKSRLKHAVNCRNNTFFHCKEGYSHDFAILELEKEQAGVHTFHEVLSSTLQKEASAMKRHCFPAVVVLFLFITLSCGGGGGGSSPPPFSQADLTGTWYVSILQASPTLAGSPEPGWIRGIATVSSSGTISVPIMETSLGPSTGPVGVVWTIDPWTGVISESSGTYPAGNPDFHGKLSANKQLVVGTATNLNTLASTTTVQLRIIQKIATSATYTVSDIADKTFMTHQIESGAGGEWMYAEGSTGPVFSGATTTGTLLSPMTYASGTTGGGAIGALSVNASGLVSLNSNSSFRGVVSVDKTYMIATETSVLDSNVFRLTVVQFKNPATIYSLSDLAGTWRNHSILSVGAWLYSTATINSAGHGTITDQHDSVIGTTAPYTFDLTMSSAGVFSDPTNTSAHSFLSPGKDLLVMTQTIAGPGSFMAVMVK
jgi:hypothetical protein